MNLSLLQTIMDRLQVETIGDPIWIDSKQVFEYQDEDIKVVTILKLVRAAQGIHALNLLCRSGLFVDMGAIYRCVLDCTAEVYFLLENYPTQSSNVDKFIKEFYSRTIDGHLSSTENTVPTKKIHNAMVRSLTGSEQDEQTKKQLTDVYKTFSGYTHAGYSHIMQMFGSTDMNPSFNISGIPSKEQKDMQMQLVIEAYKSVIHAISYAALTFGHKGLANDAIKNC